MIFSNVSRFIREADHKARHHEARNHDEAVEAATVCGLLNWDGGFDIWLADLPLSMKSQAYVVRLVLG
jgi:hypothetical protein